MKRIVRLTESDLARIVKRVMSEAPTATSQGNMMVNSISTKLIYSPNEVANLTLVGLNVNPDTKGRIFSIEATPTPEGQKLGLTKDNLNFGSFPKTLLSKYDKPSIKTTNVRYPASTGGSKEAAVNEYNVTFKTPLKAFRNETGKNIPLYTCTVTTNDSINPVQTMTIFLGPNGAFGVSGASSQN
jgi:hypothetical protein